MLRAIGNTGPAAAVALEAKQLPSRQCGCLEAKHLLPATQGSVGTWRWRFGPPQYLHLQHIERAVSSLHRGRDQARPKGTCHRVSKTRPRCMKMATNLEHEGESEKHSRRKPQPQMRRSPYGSCERKSVGARREELTPHRNSAASLPCKLGNSTAARISQITELSTASSNAVSGIRWATITKLVDVQVHRMLAVVICVSI